MSNDFNYKDGGEFWIIGNSEFYFHLRKEICTDRYFIRWTEDRVKKIVEGLNDGSIPIIPPDLPLSLQEMYKMGMQGMDSLHRTHNTCKPS